MTAHIDVGHRLLNLRHVTRYAFAARALGPVMRMGFDTGRMRAVGRRRAVTAETKLRGGFDQIGIVCSPMHIVAAEARHAPPIHQALNKIVPLHPVLMARAVGKMSETRFAQLVLFEFPVVFQIQSLMEANGPIVVLTLNRILQGLPL